ncbi:MASE1 domain-containing protein [Verticiella sediminum]|nr:MASE1 domain-containing protein [Verticiella sediminum]
MSPPSSLPSPARLVLAGLLYLLAGLVSQALDDPASSVLYVWLPSGVGVATLILAPRRQWPAYVGVFLLVEIVLRALRGEAPVTLAVLALTAVATAVLTAWIVVRLAPGRRGLGYVGALVLAALLGGIANALLDVLWISYAEDQPFLSVAVPWALADAAGVLIVAPVVLDWTQFRARRSGGPSRRDFALGAAAFVAMLFVTHVLFDGNTAERFPGSVGFALTWMPVVLAVVIGLVWGARGGSLAVLLLAIQVLYQTAQGDGPFASLETRPGESVLEAQIYLAATAVLMLLLHTLRGTRELALEQAAAWRARFELALAGSNQLMYRYDPYRDLLEWGGDLESAFGMNHEQLDTVEALLTHVHPEDRERVRVFWTARADAVPTDQTSIRYRVAHREGGWRDVTDVGSPLLDAEGEIAIVAGLCRLGPLQQRQD